MKKDLFKVYHSPIHGRGIIARCDIAEDTPIIQYIGDKITRRESDRRVEQDPNGQKTIYIFELNEKYDIDGDVKWNKARYINHTCNPNCYSDIKNNEIWIYAARDIKAGEELSYDYGFQRCDWHEQTCLCGADNCFGFIVDQKYWKAIAKTKRYQKLKSIREQQESLVEV